jgi:hypothetical protein
MIPTDHQTFTDDIYDIYYQWLRRWRSPFRITCRSMSWMVMDGLHDVHDHDGCGATGTLRKLETETHLNIQKMSPILSSNWFPDWQEHTEETYVWLVAHITSWWCVCPPISCTAFLQCQIIIRVYAPSRAPRESITTEDLLLPSTTVQRSN